MRIAKEEPSSSAAKAIGLMSAVKELHGVTAMELNKLLRDAENFTIHYLTGKGSLLKIDMEKLAGSLPLHLTTVLMSSNTDEAMFRYLLCGIRLLHSLCDLAFRNAKFEQEYHAFSHMHLMHSTLVACNLYLLTGFLSTQWHDIVHVLLAHPKVDIFMDAAFGAVRMVVRCLENTLIVYHEDISMESNFTAEQAAYYLCQQCEASLQFLQSLCQQKLFKERLLKNKELCGKGSILFLAQSILKLHIQPSFPTRIMAAISRLKAKILSILLSLCEAESISYLDEVASSAQSLDLAKSVALEVFDLLKKAFGRDPGHLTTDRSHPMGFVQLNAMRLADIFSDDSNFRSYMILCFTKVLTAIVSLSHGDFLSCWCSSNLPETEEDASLEYDIFSAVGWILDNTSRVVRNTTNLEFNLIPNSMPKASYAHQRTSLFVKFFANLHCFVPNICEEQERNLFVLKVLECLQMDLSNLLPGFSLASDAPKATIASKNLCSLLSHAESLIPNFLNVEDVQLLRVFFGELQSLFTSTGFGENRVQDSKFEESLSWDKFSNININEHYQEAQSAGGCSSPLTGQVPADLSKKDGTFKEGMSENSAFPDMDQHNTRAEETNQGKSQNRQNHVEDKCIPDKTASGGARDMDKDAQNVETSGSDTSCAKGKNLDNAQKVVVEENPEDEKIELSHRRKRKRTIMNDEQVTLIETALIDEPDMQRNAASLQSWAGKLSKHGSDVTSSQLKNWLNNRKARLARTARDVRAATGDVENSVLDKQRGPVSVSYDYADSPGDVSHASKDLLIPGRIASGDKPEPSLAPFVDIGSPEFGNFKAGQHVVLVGARGEEIGRAKVFQVQGKWNGKSLEELANCVVDVSELKADKGSRLPYPSEATGTSFAEAETKLGVMRVLWDCKRVFSLRSE
ncbi:nodulin homeobox-like isoform X2 [Abrus precatorius]|uniref:Nodulin homeobox-like isoform X2 n=1 Tax=Abrus precatorius TaxID=3816 RepID=A0A8B8K9U3_ABRPR|nr:nodulin homeobox-like isoform X2 [Abrus precatorius]